MLYSNELEEVTEKLKQKDEEAKNKVAENKENVWFTLINKEMLIYASYKK